MFPSKNRESIRLKGVWSQAQRGASRGFLPGVGGFWDFEWRDSTLEMDGDELAVWVFLGWFWDYLWFGCSSSLMIEPWENGMKNHPTISPAGVNVFGD